MATYYNGRGHLAGSAGDDSFLFDTALDSGATVDALGGIDRLVFDQSSGPGSSFEAKDNFNSGVFGGRVQAGFSSAALFYFEVEDVLFIGSAFADNFELGITQGSLGLAVEFDGGAGIDHLQLDFARLGSGITFRVEDGEIVSTFGTFSNMEKFTIHTGSGNDVIHTADEADTIYAGAGSDQILTGGGNDWIYSESGGDYVDMGTGTYDYFNGNYSDETNLVVQLGEAIAISNGVTALNVDGVTIGTGSGDDQFNVTRGGSMQLYGHSGYDMLSYDAAISGAQKFLVVTSTVGLSGTANEAGFSHMERIVLKGGAANDLFQVTGTFAPDALSFDGGAGSDRLELNFSDDTGGVSVEAGADGTVVSSRGEFAGFEIFQLIGGSGADRFAGRSGDDTLIGLGGDDRLEGRDGHDILSGGAGDDHLIGGDGQDGFFGGEGSDRMEGGPGNDTFVVADVGDLVLEQEGEGIDEVRTGLGGGSSLQQRLANAYRLAANVEYLIATSWGYGQGLRGNDLDNRIEAATGDDLVDLRDGGDDYVSAGSGRDVIYYGGAMTSADSNDAGWDGGDPRGDLLILQGDYSQGLTLAAGSIVDVEKLRLLKGVQTDFGDTGGNLYSYDITTVDANVGDGDQLVVQAGSLQLGEHLSFDGSDESDGGFQIFGGRDDDIIEGGDQFDHLLGRAGDDHLIGNGGSDRLRGGLGQDLLEGGAGADIFVYSAQGGAEGYSNAALESTSTGYDTIDGFTWGEDAIDLPNAVTAISTDTSGSLSEATFDSDLTAALGSFTASSAVLFTPDAGDLAGRHFLVVDANDSGTYQANVDFVIQLTNPGSLTPPADPGTVFG